MTTALRKTGIDFAEKMPWGTHFCCFYQTRQDLDNTVMPYLKAGLSNREFCIWLVTGKWRQKTVNTLRHAHPSFDAHLASGDLELLSYSEFLFENSRFAKQQAIEKLNARLCRALEKGFDGLRLATDGAWLDKIAWPAFAEFEREIDARFAQQNILILCAYPLAHIEASAIFDVSRTHQFALAKRHGQWEVLESPELVQAKAEIENLNKKLEQKVAKRTDELAQSNRELHGEITKRKRIAQDFRKIFENSVVGFFQSKPEGRLTTANPALARMLGYRSPGELVSSITDIATQLYEDPSQRQRFETILRTHGQVDGFEFKARCKDGSVKWLSHSALAYFGDNGKVSHYEGFVLDIDARKKAEEALRESEKWNRSLLEAIPDPIFIISRDGTYQYVKAETEDELGIPSHRIVGSNIKDAGFTQDYLQLVFSKIEEAIETKKVQTFEYELRVPSHHGHWEARATAIGNDHVLFIARDITRRVREEKRRIELERRLKQVEKAESLSRMAGAVAHHFNNMLLVVSGHLELARMSASKDAKLSQNLAEAEKAANRASEMSRLMLTYLGQEYRTPEPLDLSKICADFVEQIQSGLPEPLRVETDFPANGPVVMADPTQMAQVLRALTNNAIEATAQNTAGILQISLRTVNASEIEVQNCFPSNWQSSASHYACLTVADDGQGISAQAMGQVFDPFFTDKFTGRGLGLAVVLGIVKALGGCITVKSSPGQGSTFRVYLPALPDTF
ncbi:MAG: MEDS domain-containing protein [Thermodesulfobacteriota bacterium]